MNLEKIIDGGKKLIAGATLGVMATNPLYGCESTCCPECDKSAELLTGRYEGEIVYYDYFPDWLWQFPDKDKRNVSDKKGIVDMVSLDVKNRYVRILNPYVRDYELDSDGCFYDSWNAQEDEFQTIDLEVEGCIYTDAEEPELSLTVSFKIKEPLRGEYGYKYDFEGVKTAEPPIFTDD